MEQSVSGAISGWRRLESDGSSDVGVGKLINGSCERRLGSNEGVSRLDNGSREVAVEFTSSSGTESREEVLLDRQ